MLYIVLSVAAGAGVAAAFYLQRHFQHVRRVRRAKVERRRLRVQRHVRKHGPLPSTPRVAGYFFKPDDPNKNKWYCE